MKTAATILLYLIMTFTGRAQSASTHESPKTSQVIQNTQVKVFPNPATNLVNVLGLKNTSRADISILDIYGNIVATYRWEIRRNAINIPISTIKPGAYIITIHSEEQHIRTKFYKQ
ncbi:T9SS type A sorting domain-containing protein [Pareuzebyella sediminis]|uniref:T9SS type A sorting domain-containing protein n=1 Tax=Pareuzebyella sediminis TaxID=2607998 RepID=UPI0011F0379B|nr:T9SS type A sorting domain-containing protein [Pareuzebyella sediminis]